MCLASILIYLGDASATPWALAFDKKLCCLRKGRAIGVKFADRPCERGIETSYIRFKTAMTLLTAGKQKLQRALEEMRNEKALHLRLINIGHLLAGNFGNVVLNLGAVAFTARALGPTQYGILALVMVFAQAIERIVSFQTWQPMIRYGAELEEASRKNDLKALIKFVFLLDLATAVGGWLIAVCLATFGKQIFGWEAQTLELTLIYSLVLLFAINGAPVGILRLTGRFKTAAYVRLIAMVLRLMLCATAFVHGWPLFVFVIIWASTQILGSLFVIAAAARELHRRDLLSFLSEPLGKVSARFSNIWRFSFLANISVTIRSSAQQLDTLLVGAMLDPAAAGFYHIAKRVAKFAQQAGAQVQAVVFPEVAKLWSSGKRDAFKRVVVQTELMLAGVGALGVVAMIFLAGPLVHIFAGAEFYPAAKLLIVQMVAVALILCGSTSRVALLSMGKEVPILYASIASTVSFFVAAFLLIPQMGPMGANVAHIILGVVWLGVLWFYFRKFYDEEAFVEPESRTRGDA